MLRLTRKRNLHYREKQKLNVHSSNLVLPHVSSGSFAVGQFVCIYLFNFFIEYEWECKFFLSSGDTLLLSRCLYVSITTLSVRPARGRNKFSTRMREIMKCRW